jgi:hypothetical protein
MNNSELKFKYQYLLKLIDDAAESYTSTVKSNIYDLQRRAATVRDSNYNFQSKIEAYENFVKGESHDT